MFIFSKAGDAVIAQLANASFIPAKGNSSVHTRDGSIGSLSSIISPSSPKIGGAFKFDVHPPQFQSLDNYVIGAPAGRGRWAQVHMATHRFTRVPVALKQVRKRDSGIIQRFMLREKEAIKRVRGHPNVVQLYEVFEDSECIYLVQEYISGGSLKEKLQKRCLSEQESALCVAELASALAHCHANNVIHRDLSINNVMFDVGGRVKLVDFGLAAVDLDASTATFNEACGSAFYTPPEVHASKFGVPYKGPPVDVWAVGVVLHMCITGSLPFNGSQSQCRAGVAYKPPPKASAELQDLLTGVLEPDAAKRLTLQQILEHPWILQRTTLAQRQLGTRPVEAAEKERCIEMMEKMGIARSEVVHAISTDVYNHVAATYYMLQSATWQQKTEAVLKCAGLSNTASTKESGHESTLRQLLLKPLVSST